MIRVLAATFLAVFAAGCGALSIPVSSPPGTELREYVVHPAGSRLTKAKILLIDISGLITGGETSGLLGTGSSTVADVRDALKKARKDQRVEAVIVRIDSRGGEVTASDAVYEEIRRFKKDRADAKNPVPVIASIVGMGASGGYYVALAADKIYAYPTSVTGSIGVIATFPNLAGLTSKIGVTMRVIKSADKKDSGSLWRDFTPEERKILQAIIDEMYERFVGLVAENRPELDRDAVLRLADGRIYTGSQALANKLIDGIAYFDEVVEKTKTAADLKDASVVTYRRTSNLRVGLYAKSPDPTPQAAPQVNLVQIDGKGLLDPPRRAGFYYLWAP